MPPQVSTSKVFQSNITLLLYIMQLAAQASAATQFASHVSVSTPTRSFTHGVGDPIPRPERRNYERSSFFRSIPHAMMPIGGGGYPREKPTVPFTHEDTPRDISAWQYNNFIDVAAIPLLPPSPYKVDSPDPESLWPEGLFLPPINPPHFGSNRRSDGQVLSEPDPLDPYLLEGSEAIAAVKKADHHGHLFFHEIPHIDSLLANQQLRIKNNLKPHKVASIRHTWPYYRP